MYIGKVTRSLAWWEGEGVDIKISDLSSKSQPHAWSKYSLQLGRRGKLGPLAMGLSMGQQRDTWY